MKRTYDPQAYDKRALQAFTDAIAHTQSETEPAAFRLGDDMSPLVYAMLKCIGEDPAREGLVKTPARVDSTLKFLTKGYHEKLANIVGDALFETDNDDIVMVKDIEVFSLCEHHMLPFWGNVHIAYIPDGKVIGLSKLPRIAEMFARRLQLQERLTNQIVDAVMEAIQPKGAAVLVDCQHMCMMMRGVEKNESATVTRAFRGAFKKDATLRADFMRLVER